MGFLEIEWILEQIKDLLKKLLDICMKKKLMIQER